MSGFDSNPFADPDANNPFSDPSVTQVTASSNSNAQKGLEEYNPFANQQNKAGGDVRGASNPPPTNASNQPYNQPAVMQPTPNVPPPPYTSSAAQNISTSELQRRQEELEKKAEELQKKEQALRSQPYNSQQNNWPPLPQKCCVGPCFYQDITVDIPLEFQKLVRTGYYLWIFHGLVLILNFCGALAYFIESGEGVTFGMSLLFVVACVPLSFVCWFRPLYKAFKSDSSFNFFIFFFIFFFQFCISVLFAIGIPKFGSCGFINGLTVVGSSTPSGYAVGGILLIIGFMWGLDSLASGLLLLKVHRIYRNTDASFAKAQAEFTTGVIRNEHVQSAATQVAATAARETVNQTFANAGNQNRY